MKTCNFLIATLIFCIFSACLASQPLSTKWREDGRVVSSDGRVIQLNLQSVYGGLEYNNTTYVIGFTIDNGGINIPRLAAVSSNFGDVRYWTFDNIISDVFVYKGSLHVNDVDGKVFILSGDSWQETSLTFPENSQVVFSDGMKRLIVCHPASMLKTHDHRGGCYSMAPDWRYDFIWFRLTPKVCDGRLHIYENKMRSGIFRVLSLESGKALYSMPLPAMPDDLCGVTGSDQPGE